VNALPRFLVVGASGVLVNSLALYALYQLLHVPLALASPLAVEVAIVNNFVWNDRWTFRRARPTLARFARFNVVSMLGMLITTITIWLLVHQIGLHYLLANLAGISLATACNFAINTEWTWRTA